MAIKDAIVTPRGDVFAERLRTRITDEQAQAHNPYLAERRYTHGYEIGELLQHAAFDEMVFLLLRGDLPTPAQRRLFNALLVALANPGLRDPAVRAGATAAASKTELASLLPIGSAIAGGAVGGGGEVSGAMRFIRRHRRRDPAEVAAQHFAPGRADAGDRLVAPGFGSSFGTHDSLSTRLAAQLARRSEDGQVFAWCNAFVAALNVLDPQLGWRWWGVCAATLLELGFHPRAGTGVYQFAVGAGALAHALEWHARHYTDLPFVSEDNYFVDDQAV